MTLDEANSALRLFNARIERRMVMANVGNNYDKDLIHYYLVFNNTMTSLGYVDSLIDDNVRRFYDKAVELYL